MQLVGKENARSTLNAVTRQENIYGFKLKNIAVSIGKDDFILPKFGYINRGDHHLFFLEDKNIPDEINKKYQTTSERQGYI